MVAYAVTDWTSAIGTLDAVAALMETQLETVDDAKTIRYADVVPSGGGGTLFKGALIYDA